MLACRLTRKSSLVAAPPVAYATRSKRARIAVRELLQRLAADDVRVARAGVADDEPPVLVARAVALAALVPDLDEHEVRVLAGQRVPAEERLGELVVRQLLVDDAVPGLVDEQHRVAGDGEHPDELGVARERLLERDRAHPRVVHVAQLRAERPGDAHEVALVRDRRAAAVDRRGEEVRPQLGVVGEAAGGEHDRLARADAHRRPVRRRRLDADDRVAVGDDALHAVPGPHVDPVALRRGAQRADGVQPAVGHRLAGVDRHEHAAGRGLVLGQLGPVVGDRLAVAVGQRAALGQQLRGRRGALVDRADLRRAPRR